VKLFKILIFVILVFFSCEKADEYSEIPFIEFKEFTFEIEEKNGFVNQIGNLSFDFVDGNGDIGFFENSDSTISEEIYDGFVYEFIKQNDTFIPNDTIKFVLPFFEEGVYRKHIKGEMKFKIYLIERENDTLKYSFQIMDREYHLSNLDSTPELIVPEWN